MKELIFGSVAAKHWFPDFRDPKDLDLISKSDFVTRDVQKYWIPEFEILLQENKHPKYLDPNLLYCLKCSHFKWNIYWSKTAGDILFFQKKNLVLDRGLYFILLEGFKKLHGRRWVSLKDKDSDSFFKDAVKRDFNHDDLHECVAVYDRPLYERILKYPETKSVECSEEKFDGLSFSDKILLVKEEIWVTALERYLIPSNFTCGDNSAYFKSLKKLVTTMSSGWFSLFIIENFQFLYKNDDFSFIKKARTKYKI